jgi:hypothetical protein
LYSGPDGVGVIYVKTPWGIISDCRDIGDGPRLRWMCLFCTQKKELRNNPPSCTSRLALHWCPPGLSAFQLRLLQSTWVCLLTQAFQGNLQNLLFLLSLIGCCTLAMIRSHGGAFEISSGGSVSHYWQPEPYRPNSSFFPCHTTTCPSLLTLSPTQSQTLRHRLDVHLVNMVAWSLRHPPSLGLQKTAWGTCFQITWGEVLFGVGLSQPCVLSFKTHPD